MNVSINERQLRLLISAVEAIRQQLILNKGIEKFIFRYEDGHEEELLDAFVDQAKDKRTNFDWFDAAVLSFKLTQTLISRAEGFLCNKMRVQVPVD